MFALETGKAWRDGLHVERTLIRDTTMQRLMRRGLLVNVWTVNDVREATDLAAIGVDGIITDVPGLVRASFGD